MQKKCFKIEDSFYPENIIAQAIKDFKEISNISLNDWQLEIESETLEEIDEIFNEFMNYVIWLYNELN